MKSVAGVVGVAGKVKHQPTTHNIMFYNGFIQSVAGVVSTLSINSNYLIIYTKHRVYKHIIYFMKFYLLHLLRNINYCVNNFLKRSRYFYSIYYK